MDFTESYGEVKLHARVTNRLAADLRGLLWAVRSLRDLHIDNCEIWSDSAGAVEAISNKEQWPLFRGYLKKIHHLASQGQGYKFCVSSSQANSIARDIAKSVTRIFQLVDQVG